MANKFRGEATVLVNDKAVTMVLDFNAMCDLEDETGEGIEQFLSRFESDNASNSDIRLMVGVLLRDRQPNMTVREVGALISEDPQAVMKGCTDAIRAAFPEAKVPANGAAPAGN